MKNYYFNIATINAGFNAAQFYTTTTAETVAEPEEKAAEFNEFIVCENSPAFDKFRALALNLTKAAKTTGAKVAKVAKNIILKGIALSSCAFVFALAISLMLCLCFLGGDALEAIETAQGGSIPFALRFAVIVVYMFTIVLDVCGFVEINTMELLNRLHAFAGFGGLSCHPGFVRPCSFLYLIIKAFKED